jgi:hypothetical protein
MPVQRRIHVDQAVASLDLHAESTLTFQEGAHETVTVFFDRPGALRVETTSDRGRRLRVVPLDGGAFLLEWIR